MALRTARAVAAIVVKPMIVRLAVKNMLPCSRALAILVSPSCRALFTLSLLAWTNHASVSVVVHIRIRVFIGCPFLLVLVPFVRLGCLCLPSVQLRYI